MKAPPTRRPKIPKTDDYSVMAAILGIYERCAGVRPEDGVLASLENLTGSGRYHRDRWVGPSVVLTHQRTAFSSDHSVEKALYYDVSNDLVVTADVRLDNRTDLAAKFGIAESELANRSDTSLILSAWMKWGKDCSKHLFGDYAFAVWDIRQETLFCSRDHIGARPFYYSVSPERFVFASEIKTVLAIPGVSDRLDEDYVVTKLLDKTFYSKDRTFVKAVRRLAPGHNLFITRNNVKLERYWFPEKIRKVRFVGDDDYAEAAREIYDKAVRSRLRGSRSIGVHVSGGLDSSSVAVLAARECRRQNKPVPAAYAWQPPPPKNSENPGEHERIAAICKQEGLVPQYCGPTPEDILRILDKDPAREPVDTTLQIETAVQNRASAHGTRLILSGWGGDETLSHSGRDGYTSGLLLRGHWCKLYKVFERSGGSPLKLMLVEALLLPFRDRDKAMAKIAARSFRISEQSNSLISSAFVNRKKIGQTYRRHMSIRSTMLADWEAGHLAERMESWAASGAAKQISYAYPLLDRRLMEFVIGLPPEQFVRGKWKRWIMRNAMDGILPASVRWHSSKRDQVQLGHWQTQFWRALEKADERLVERAEPPSRSRYFDMERLTKCLRSNESVAQKRPGEILNAMQFLDF